MEKYSGQYSVYYRDYYISMENFIYDYFRNLKCFIIQSPIEVLDHPLCESIFYKTLKLKVDGFDILKTKYLAIDQNDFLVTHVVLCEEREMGFYPVMSFKVINQEHAAKWNIPFSGEDVVNKTKSEIHIEAVKRFMRDSQEQGIKVAYPGSMTIATDIQKREIRMELIQMFQALLTFYHKEFYPSRSICIARDKVKSEFFLKEMGFSQLTDLNGEIPSLSFPQYLNDHFKIMVMKDDFSLHAYRMRKMYASLIENATELSRVEGIPTERLVQHWFPSRTTA